MAPLTPQECQVVADHLDIVEQGLQQTKDIMLEDPNIDDMTDLLEAVASVDFQIATIQKVKEVFRGSAEG